MLIFIKNSNNKQGGPNVFKDRLVKALNAVEGVSVTNNLKEPFDVELAFIHIDAKHDKPVVLRLDGCYYMGDSIGMNRGIQKSASRATRVVFQSRFSRMFCADILGMPFDNCEVIYNGINLDWLSRVKPAKDIPPGSFIACADWRHNKRPMSTIKGFLESGIDSTLYMVGNGIDKPIIDRRVRYVGRVTGKELIGMFKACQYQIHLCHIDSCPNAVIEGLCCGLNVLHTNLGGTVEIVGIYGVNIICDEPVSKPIPKQDMDNLDPKIVATGIHRLIENWKERPVRPDLDMKITTDKYLNVLRSVL